MFATNNLTYKLDNIESDFHPIFIGKHGLYHIFWYIPKSYCISQVLSFAFSQWMMMVMVKCSGIGATIHKPQEVE